MPYVAEFLDMTAQLLFWEEMKIQKEILRENVM